MSISLKQDYKKGLRSAKPTVLSKRRVKPPPGALGAVTDIPAQVIPPLNTNIQFNILPKMRLAARPGLAAVDPKVLPENFNWKDNGGAKSSLLSTPGNQMLCGSCWAISAAGIIADNHVVSGTVDWKPNLSTTWCLACYPQYQCQGGNPAVLYGDVANSGIASNNCVDYSWCSQNENCNGKATQHFEAGELNLSDLIPSCGCYNGDVKHYLYKIDSPSYVSIGQGDLTEDNFAITLKKHIYTNGPVQGGFLVFRNFMSGGFSKVNGGVYLETGVYDNTDSVHFDDEQVSADNYAGSHAVAIIGWGVQKGVVVDNKGTKNDVPYWYCRNSWGTTWGDGGYFKMPMYSVNRVSQFDKAVIINTPSGNFQGGGMILMSASSPPELKTLGQLQQIQQTIREKPDSYYATEEQDKGSGGGGGDSGGDSGSGKFKINMTVVKYALLCVVIIGVIGLLIFFIRKWRINRSMTNNEIVIPPVPYMLTRNSSPPPYTRRMPRAPSPAPKVGGSSMVVGRASNYS